MAWHGFPSSPGSDYSEKLSPKMALLLKCSSKVKQHYLVVLKVRGKVWPGFKNKYDLDIYDLR